MLAAHSITCSLSRAGDCYDNAVAESLSRTLKRELIEGRTFATRAEAAAAIDEYLANFYDRRRRHSTLGDVSPVELALRAMVQAA